MNKDKKIIETCDFCGGEVLERKQTIDFHYPKNPIIIEDVPVKVRKDCGEKYCDAHVWEELEKIAQSNKNIKREIIVPVKEYSLEAV